MKVSHFKFSLLISLISFFLGTTSTELFASPLAEAKVGLMDVNLKLNVKVGYYIHPLEESAEAKFIKTSYFPNWKCPNNAYVLNGLAVRDSASQKWLKGSYVGNGTYQVAEASFDAIRIDFTRNSGANTVCRILAEGIGGGSTPPDSSVEELAGVLNYSGGYQHRLPVVIDSVWLASSFRVEVPEFCEGVEVSSAGVEIDGTYQAGSLKSASTRVYTFKEPTNLAQILVSLNGPIGQACEVPVFAINPIKE